VVKSLGGVGCGPATEGFFSHGEGFWARSALHIRSLEQHATCLTAEPHRIQCVVGIPPRRRAHRSRADHATVRYQSNIFPRGAHLGSDRWDWFACKMLECFKRESPLGWSKAPVLWADVHRQRVTPRPSSRARAELGRDLDRRFAASIDFGLRPSACGRPDLRRQAGSGRYRI
jgi:hypothetical protein